MSVETTSTLLSWKFKWELTIFRYDNLYHIIFYNLLCSHSVGSKRSSAGNETQIKTCPLMKLQSMKMTDSQGEVSEAQITWYG